ncbi:hypothetical protein CerSpe_090290 [Prunus speciosa]
MGGGLILRYMWMVGLFAIVGNNWGGVEGAGECGQLDPEVLIYKLASCAASGQDKNVEVPPKCCGLMQKVRTSCLCAIILSKEAKSLGINPVVAVTIPKRCKIAGRPKGYKCGGTLCGASMTKKTIWSWRAAAMVLK